jgi:LysR family transcriptional regulator, hca operon transcriptional activator
MSSRRGQLRYLCTVAEEGQITSAARRLKIAQPTLTRAITQLEGELGIELLERHARGVTLTAAGEAFVAKARVALAAEDDAARAAEALARATRRALAVGFIGPPPAASTPELFAAFCDEEPGSQVAFRDLPFPRGTTSAWLAEVDVALCHPPLLEAGVSALAVRVEPRAVVARAKHPLAQRGELSVEDVLDQTFTSYHPDVQREWAGFHSLDDHRGAPPHSLTGDHALTSLQMAGIMSMSAAITTVPIRDAQLAERLLPGIVAIPLRDAKPALVSLVWHSENRNPLLHTLLSAARRLAPSEDGI